MNSSILLISGLCWLGVGFILGNMVAINRLIHSEELKEKLADLRDLRYQADRAKTVYHVAKMLDRVNTNLLLEIFEEISKSREQALKKAKENASQN